MQTMNPLNPQEIGNALQRICSQLSDQQANILRQFFSSSRSRIVGCIARPVHSEEALSWGRLGGSPMLPEDFTWPKDRFERPMLFVAQFDLAKMPRAGDHYPAGGLLTIFRSLQAAKLNLKDRRAFAISFFNGPNESEPAQNLVCTSHPTKLELASYAFDSGVTWTVSEDFNPLYAQMEISDEIANQAFAWAQAFNNLAYCQAQLFGNNINDLELLKQLCAFSANGISYSYKRAADPLYGHLIQQSQDWTVLARIREAELFGTESGADESIIMIRNEDLANRQLEKAWSISRGPTFHIES
jgi:uncharacterized protein YwqG